MSIGKHFRIYSSIVHFLPALQVSANLMQKTPFYFKLKFSLEKLKRLCWHGIENVVVGTSFTRSKVIKRIEFIKYENRKNITKIQLYLLLI